MDLYNCKLKKHCKQNQECDFRCYPCTILHGVDGKTGLWKTRNVPRKYDNCFLENLPPIDPPQTRKVVSDYIEWVTDVVEQGVGLYLFSKSSKNNPLGTGNGKTTTAVTILNEFLVRRVITHLQGNELKTNPVLFMEMADFQNIYNAQFRGTRDNQEQASEIFYRYKDRMKKVELLVIDDIAIRNATEAFMNEFYEIVNHRVNEDLATIYTSNEPLTGLVEIFGERIVSRIEGSTLQYPFAGKDHRRKEWF